MRTFVQSVPLSAVALLMTVIAAIAFGGAVARRLHTSWAVAALLLFGFGFVISATLMPTAAALDGEVSDGVCELRRLGLPSLHELLRVSDASLNVLLFVPLGFALGLLPRNRAASGVIIGAVLLTFVVETLQLLLVGLGRDCQVRDIVTNLLGLGIGACLGVLAGALIRPLLRGRFQTGG
jgi:hypothetical protein